MGTGMGTITGTGHVACVRCSEAVCLGASEVLHYLRAHRVSVAVMPARVPQALVRSAIFLCPGRSARRSRALADEPRTRLRSSGPRRGWRIAKGWRVLREGASATAPARGRHPMASRRRPLSNSPPPPKYNCFATVKLVSRTVRTPWQYVHSIRAVTFIIQLAEKPAYAGGSARTAERS